MKPHQRVASRHIARQNIEPYYDVSISSLNKVIEINVIINEGDGDDEIGFIEGKYGVYTLDEISDYACSEDMLVLHDLWEGDAEWHDGIPVVEVINSSLSPEYQSKRLGLQMYKELGNLAKEMFGRVPMFFIPNYCSTRVTSDKALRVWKSLTKSNAPTSSGDVVLMVDRKLR